MRRILTRAAIPAGALLAAFGPAGAYEVTNANDAGTGSLRQAILDANGHAGLDSITFAIGTGAKTIALKSPLPVITDPVQIFGVTQPGFVDHPLIELNGAGAGAGAAGLHLAAQGCIVVSLCVNRFSGNGIVITGPGGCYVADCTVGTDPAATTGHGNAGAGVLILDSPNNTVYGGFGLLTQGNGHMVVSGNGTGGIVIDGPQSMGNVVTRCYIGLNGTGGAAIPNAGDGVRITREASGNRIGAATEHERNVISGNSQTGIHLGVAGELNPHGNTVIGNTIGLNASGTAAIPNPRGVHITGADSNTIGGGAAGAGNIIAGNAINVHIEGTHSFSNRVLGNRIGTNAGGTAGFGGNIGVWIESASNNAIGGAGAGEGNVISGHANTGVQIDNGLTDVPAGNSVRGNLIGTNAAGTAAVPNGKGIYLYNASTTMVGGPTPAERNVISGNTAQGVYVFVFGTQASSNTIQGNLIGLNAAGAAAVGNGGTGVYIVDAPSNYVSGNAVSGNGVGVLIADAGGSGGNAIGNTVQGNRIGTDAAGAYNIGNTGDGVTISGNVVNTSISSNLISGNGGAGVSIHGTGAFPATGNTVSSNFIGTNAGGTAGLGNATGVSIGQNAQGTTVSGNLISGNGDGVDIQGSGITGTSLVANLIGTNAAGTAAVPNSKNGILSLSGDPAIGPGNVVSGNTLTGIIVSAAAAGTIQGNTVGATADGTAALPNGGAGVRLEQTSGVLVGGTGEGAGNLISGNAGNGLEIAGPAAAGNTVQGNQIGTDAAGTARVANGGSGILIEQSSGNTIGGPAAGAGNLVSGNGQQGVMVNATTPAGGTLATTANVVAGNTIGTDITGTAALGNAFSGIVIIDADSNTVGGTPAGAGNLISGNGGSGVTVISNAGAGSHNAVLGNRIGTNAAGTAALGNAGRGIDVSGAPDTTIGGTAPEARNVISGNGTIGVVLHNKATGTVIQGNRIGTDAAGAAAIANGGDGVFVENAPGNTIGGTAAGAGNVISGNGAAGIHFLDADANHNTVQGNLIGTGADGTTMLPNASHGIAFKAADDNTVGGPADGAGNTIRGNGGAGIFVESGLRDAFSRNAISGNGGLGIDLEPAGPGASDANANKAQPAPAITGVTVAGGTMTVTGTLDAAANTAYTVELFANTAADPSGFGEGETFVHAAAVTTDAGGHAAFNASFATATPAGHPVSATATDPDGNTSEFSRSFGLLGDANGDGAVDTADVAAILRCAGGLGTAAAFGNGDVAPSPSGDPRGYGDGRLDALDAVRVARHLAGLETGW